MSQSLSKILLHIVFSTKNRTNLIPPKLMPPLHAYLAGVCRTHGCEAFRIGGTENHVHIACSFPRVITVSTLLRDLKKSSTIWMKENGAPYYFGWQGGYGVFSLGQSQLRALARYIDNQEEHHKRATFEEELKDLLDKYGVEYNEKYLWG